MIESIHFNTAFTHLCLEQPNDLLFLGIPTKHYIQSSHFLCVYV